MICVAIRIIAKKGQENAIEALFTKYIPLVEKLPGVLGFQLHRSRSNPRHFLLYELYDSYQALLRHRNDEEFAVWRPRIAALEESREMEEYDTTPTLSSPIPETIGGNKVVINTGDISPVPFPIPGATEEGVTAQLVNLDVSKGIIATIIHIAAGAQIPAHYHKNGAEAHYVLAGEFYENGVLCPPGTYLTHAANVIHGPHSSKHGCSVLTLQSAYVDPALPDFYIATPIG